MPSKLKIIISISAIALFFALGFLFFANNSKIPDVQAAATDNIAGWAWSENIGWISFNSLNCDTNNNNFIDAAGACGGDDATTPVMNYGVNIAGGGNLSGYAWSENVGWISFEPADIVGCPSGVCQPRYDSAKNEFFGWARALAFGGGWDGWISLNSENCDVAGGISNGFIDVACGGLDNATTPVVNYNPKLNGNNFEDWAWGGNVAGWISFNSINCDSILPLGQSDGGAGCPPAGTPMSNYKVYVTGNAPSVTLSNPNVPMDYCNDAPADVLFSWNYNDPDNIPPGTDPQSFYQVKLARSDGAVCDTLQQPGAASSITGAAINGIPACVVPGGFINYNFSYVWEVKVWDSSGLSSSFISSNPGNNFAPPINAYPNVAFNSPLFTANPIGQVQFDYTASADMGRNIIKLEWDFEGDGIIDETEDATTSPLIIPSNSINSSKVHTYTTSGNYTVKLIAYDDSPSLPPFACFNNTTANVNVNIPKWKEVSPSS